MYCIVSFESRIERNILTQRIQKERGGRRDRNASSGPNCADFPGHQVHPNLQSGIPVTVMLLYCLELCYLSYLPTTAWFALIHCRDSETHHYHG